MSARQDDFWADFAKRLREMNPVADRIYYGELKLARVWPARNEPDPERRELLIGWAQAANKRTARGAAS